MHPNVVKFDFKVLSVGDDFVRLLDEYLQPGFHKGIPPLFVNLKGLYKDSFKVHNTVLWHRGEFGSLQSVGEENLVKISTDPAQKIVLENLDDFSLANLNIICQTLSPTNFPSTYIYIIICIILFWKLI